MDKLKVVFLGTPLFSVPTLEKLINIVDIVLVVTSSDKIRGRGSKTSFSPIKKYALNNNLKVIEPNTSDELYKELKELEFDILLTIAYGKILKPEVLALAKIANINIHSSLLPKYRGADPITFALLNGEEKTGITIMYMNEFMDEGDILFQKEVLIDKLDNYETLYDKLSIEAGNLISEVINKFLTKKIKPQKQNHSLATYTRKITREDERISFNDTGVNITNKVKALYPNAYIMLNSKEIKLLEVDFIKKENTTVKNIIKTKKELGIECLDGIIYLRKVKPESKRAMDINSYINGLNNDIIVE